MLCSRLRQHILGHVTSSAKSLISFHLAQHSIFHSFLLSTHISYQIDWLLSLLSITAAQVKALQPLCEHLAQSFLIYLDVLK